MEPIAYVIRILAPATHEIVVQAAVPTSGQPSLDLMMPTWSPGYYRVEDYAANVRDATAETLDGQPLVVEKTNAKSLDKIHRASGAALHAAVLRRRCGQVAAERGAGA